MSSTGQRRASQEGVGSKALSSKQDGRRSSMTSDGTKHRSSIQASVGLSGRRESSQGGSNKVRGCRKSSVSPHHSDGLDTLITVGGIPVVLQWP